MNMTIRQAVILAGGMGTRLKPFTNTKPKPMYPFQGVPFLEHLIRQVKQFGIYEVLLLLGYLPDVIIDYFGDGSKFGVKIKYHITHIDFDTGARIKSAAEMLDKYFLLMYCDNYCPIIFDRAVAQFRSESKLLQLTAYTNKDGYTRNNLKYDSNFNVVKYEKQRESVDLNAVDIGYVLVNKEVLSLIPAGNVNFEAEVYPKLTKTAEIGTYITDHRYYSVGSYDRIKLTEEFFKPKKVIFLDRDGTLNVKAGRAQYIERPQQFKWLAGAREALKILSKNDYMILIITNQPGIQREMVTWENLNKIHHKMLTDLAEDDVLINKIYICPHGWDDNCDCRKPKPGMLYQAQKEYSLNLPECILIGDDERDITAGMSAGCKAFMVTSDNGSLLDIVKNIVSF